MTSNIDYSIVIPVYNSENTLDELAERIANVFKGITEYYEVILVDDRSIDGSWQKIKGLHEKDRRMKIIRLTRNFGQHNALMCGFNQAQGNYIIIMDDDLQNPPEEIPKLINKIKDDFLVVYGEYEIKRHGTVENILSNFFKILKYNILDIPKHIYVSNFAIIQSAVIKKIISIKTAYPFIAALIFKNVPLSKISNANVVHSERKNGKSNYNLIRYILFASNLLINHSFLPILFIWCLGILTTMLSIVFGIIALFKISHRDFGVIGWDSSTIIITFLIGMILISLGIIGEYLRRVLNELSNEPQYIIDEENL
jgi:glycosyltransferase involved in cell wall biosynthesis